ncbi:MAG: CIA30 family protein [Myxococcota bacterium]
MIAWVWGVMALAADPIEVLTPQRAWTTVHDTVMGGVSEGQVIPLEDDHGGVTFTGTVSLENNGGFASARTVPASLGLDGIDALRIEIKGDGQQWFFSARRDDLRLPGGSWRVPVQTTGERQVVELPLSAFRATAFGRPVPQAPPLDAAHIDSVGFLIGSKQAGPFALTVYRITGVLNRDPALP